METRYYLYTDKLIRIIKEDLYPTFSLVEGTEDYSIIVQIEDEEEGKIVFVAI